MTLPSRLFIAAATASLLLAGCQSSSPPPPAVEPPPLEDATDQGAAAPASGKLGNSNETVSGLTSADCLARIKAGTIDPEACLEPGI
jgi:hypothetical protein